MSRVFENDGPEGGSSRRRSKMEMVCDLMLAISKGAVRPTRIMQRANLTWNTLLMYLYALASNGLVWREAKGSVAFYHLTEKGARVLEAYLTLKQGLGSLKLESMGKGTLAEAMRIRTGPPHEDADLEALVEQLRGDGYKILPPVVKGKSGVEHQFEVVAKDPTGVTNGYVFARQPDDKTILGLFVKQLDTGLRVHVVHWAEPGSLAARRAKEYGVELIRVQNLRPIPKRGPRSDY